MAKYSLFQKFDEAKVCPYRWQFILTGDVCKPQVETAAIIQVNYWKDTAKKRNRREKDSLWTSNGNYRVNTQKLIHTGNVTAYVDPLSNTQIPEDCMGSCFLWDQVSSKRFPVISVSHQKRNTRRIVCFMVFLCYYINLFQNLKCTGS